MPETDEQVLRRIADDPMVLEIGRRAIEDELIEWRDDGLQEMFRNNGLVVKSVDGMSSSIIRFGPEFALRIALIAIADSLCDGNKLSLE